jgi:hypothetical protein
VVVRRARVGLRCLADHQAASVGRFSQNLPAALLREEMANQWFRFYHEWDSDPKVQSMSEAMQRRLAMLFCSRCRGETLQEQERAFHWRIDEAELAETKSVFMQKGFIDEKWNLINWNKRQFLSDSSTDRVRRHRQALKRKETLHETLHETSVTAPDTDTDTDTEDVGLSPSEPRLRLGDFTDSWNEHCGKLPKVEKLTDGRRKKLQARIRQGLTLDRWREAIHGCATKPFLMGSNGSGWTATFDWLLANDTNVEKAITNPYGVGNQADNGKGNSVSFAHQTKTSGNFAEAEAALRAMGYQESDSFSDGEAGECIEGHTDPVRK